MRMRSHQRGGTFQAEVQLPDQKRLHTLFAHERAMYNQIIDTFEARCRSMPHTILKITPQVKQLFLEVVSQGINWKTQVNTEWPDLLKKACGVTHMKLEGQHDLMLQELSKRNWSVLPHTKKRMLWSMLDFYQDQARIFAEPQHSDLMEVSYKVPPANLTRMDERLKRHAQVAKQNVHITHVSETDHSEIQTPLTHKPIVVQGINLNYVRDWDLMLIRQEAGNLVDYLTPWQVEFRSTQGKYLLKAIDVGSSRRT
jgi:hypothetical protein